jgi:hypothetical protein
MEPIVTVFDVVRGCCRSVAQSRFPIPFHHLFNARVLKLFVGKSKWRSHKTRVEQPLQCNG